MAMLHSDNSAKAIGASLGQYGNTSDAPAPRTIASAASRIDGVNERLSGITDALVSICQQIGAMTALNQISGANSAPQAVASGAVNRLNDSADDAHSRLSTVENYVASIQRALG